MPTLSPVQPSRAKTRQFPSFVLESQEIFNVPHTRQELSWQLGEEERKLPRLRFLLACSLIRSHFEQPHNPI
jgi:hypothetical protein